MRVTAANYGARRSPRAVSSLALQLYPALPGAPGGPGAGPGTVDLDGLSVAPYTTADNVVRRLLFHMLNVCTALLLPAVCSVACDIPCVTGVSVSHLSHESLCFVCLQL